MQHYFGNYILEAINEIIIKDLGEFSDSYSVFSDPENRHNGVIWFAEGEVQDGKGEVAGKRVFALYQDISGRIELTHPSILWDLKPEPNIVFPEEIKSLLSEKNKIIEHIVSKILFDYRSEILKKREKERLR